jgi:uncharacterized DUF497 family protein
MQFEWDEAKDQANQEKHKVSFAEAQEAFFDTSRLVIKDEKHSSDEDRYFCIGKTNRGILTVRFTMRGSSIRLIGAGYWREGKARYEKEN